MGWLFLQASYTSGDARDEIDFVHAVCHEAMFSGLPIHLSTLPYGVLVFASPQPPSHTFPEGALPLGQVSLSFLDSNHQFLFVELLHAVPIAPLAPVKAAKVRSIHGKSTYYSNWIDCDL